MTNNTKNAGIIFAFAAILMASPIAIGSAYAETGDGQIDGLCSVTIPSNINLGTITPGADTGESVVSFDTTGSIAGSFEITSDTDWVGLGSKATGSLLVEGDLDGDTVTINGQVLTGADAPGANQFDTSGGTNALQAAALATAINADTQTGSEDVGTGISVTAHATGNAVLLTSTIRGTSTNGVLSVASSVSGTDITIVTATLDGGAAAATHINSEDVHYEVQVDGAAAPASTYASKAALGATTENVVLETATAPAEAVDVYFHFNGVDTAATGTVEVLGTVADGDQVTIGGTTFTAEFTSADVDGNEFLAGVSANADAIALKAAIDAVPNNPDATTGTVAGGTIPLTASRAGTPGNSVALSQSSDGFTLSGAGNLAGGVDAILALPYDGPIAATMTFTADCE